MKTGTLPPVGAVVASYVAPWRGHGHVQGHRDRGHDNRHHDGRADWRR